MQTSRFKLKGKPFGLNPDPKYFFNSDSHKRAISTLGYGLGQGQGFIVVTGDSGSGKTMLVHALEHLLNRTDIIAARIQNTQLQALDMLRYVAAEFGLDFEGLSKVALIKNLQEFFEYCRTEQKRAVLIIDEAQNLDETAFNELQMINNLLNGQENLFQVVLLGTRTLNEKLYQDAFANVRRRIVATCHLHRLSEDESYRYIQHRLRTAGWVGEPAISEAALVAIFEYSDGLPSQINALCQRLFVTAEVMELAVIEEDLVHEIVQEINEQFSDDVGSDSLVDTVITTLKQKKRARTLPAAADQTEIATPTSSLESQTEAVPAEKKSDQQETDLEQTVDAVEETVLDMPEVTPVEDDADLNLEFEATEITLDQIPDHTEQAKLDQDQARLEEDAEINLSALLSGKDIPTEPEADADEDAAFEQGLLHALDEAENLPLAIELEDSDKASSLPVMTDQLDGSALDAHALNAEELDDDVRQWLRAQKAASDHNDLEVDARKTDLEDTESDTSRTLEDTHG